MLNLAKSRNLDPVFKWVCLGCAAVAGVLMLGFFIQLATSSAEAWRTFGLGFIFSTEWNPSLAKFGALPSITGTLLTTLIALGLALPPAFAVALYLVNARPLPSAVLSHAIDLLAAIPSVIYGMWGLFVLVPIMQKYIQPVLATIPGLSVLRLSSQTFNGFGILTAGIILSIMILPYICAVMRDVLLMTPKVLLESAYGIGCTRYEVAKDIILRYGISGILGGVFIGVGRALGETMAVLFVIGNLMELPHNFFSSGTTIAATLANNFAEADGLQKSVLFSFGLILLAMCFSVQVLSQYYLHATAAKRGTQK